MPEPAPLIVFSDDWGRHPSSCQHLIANLLPRRSVTWVNTIGTRPPGLNWSTVTRGLGKIRTWLGSRGPTPQPLPRVPTPPAPLPAGRGEKALGGDAGSLVAEVESSCRASFPPLPAGRGAGGVGPCGGEDPSPLASLAAPPGPVPGPVSGASRGPGQGEGQKASSLPPPSVPVGRVGGLGPAPTVLNPKMWPSFRSRFGRALNRRLLTRALGPVAEAMPTAPVVITTIPLVADLVGRFRAARWVYYCVDDFSVWPGLDGRTMRDMEAALIPKIDVAIAVSEMLQAHLAKFGKPSRLLTHGVDVDFWRARAASDSAASLAAVDALPRPLVVYWGVVDPRTDVSFVKALNDRMDAGTILFVGPQESPDAELLRLSRVRAVPPLPFAQLSALAQRASVLIAPYADLPVTRAMQPLKLKEYIATGKPVVVRKLPATAEWADCVDVVETAEGFALAVLERLRTGVPESQRQARKRLESEGWSAKAELFEKWLDGKE